MADVKPYEEGSTALPEKRKPDIRNPINEVPEDQDSNKKQKIEIPSQENAASPRVADEDTPQRKEFQSAGDAHEREDDERDEEDRDYKAGQEDDGDGHSNGAAGNVDEKGKGIVMDDKGKGKMLEDSDEDDSAEDDDDSSDDSDGYITEDMEGDFDDVMASRTMQRGGGIRIFDGNKKGNDA